jgi:hypothetical protein
VRFIGTETHEGGVALPELIEDLGALGMGQRSGRRRRQGRQRLPR